MDNQPATISSKRQGSRLLNLSPNGEKRCYHCIDQQWYGSNSKTEHTTQKRTFLSVAHKFTHTVGDHMPDDNAKVLPYGKFEGMRSDYKVEIERRNEAWCCYSYACRIVPDIWFVRHQGAFVRCKICTSYQLRILSLAVLKNASNWKCCVSTEDHWPIF